MLQFKGEYRTKGIKGEAKRTNPLLFFSKNTITEKLIV